MGSQARLNRAQTPQQSHGSHISCRRALLWCPFAVWLPRHCERLGSRAHAPRASTYATLAQTALPHLLVDTTAYSRTAYREQVAMMRAKGLWPQTSGNKPQRVDLIKKSKQFLDEAASMDAPRETKIKTFLQSMKTLGEAFADSPIVRQIANKGLMILKIMN